MKITRARFASAVQFFEAGFRQRWKLESYLPNEPALFFGCYSQTDIETVLQHKGPKIVMLLGADMCNLHNLKKDKSIIFASDKKFNLDIFQSNGVPFMNAVIPLKDFSDFQPVPKGDKVYCYINKNTPAYYQKHTGGILDSVISFFGKDKFIFGTLGRPQADVISDYYAPAFINLQINPFAGFTTAIEMAHMGRKSISNSPAPFSIRFETPDDIIEIIKGEKENQRIENLVGDYLYNSDDWLEI